MPADIDEVTAGVLARANHIVNAIFPFVASIFPSLVEPSGRGVHCDGAAVSSHHAIRLPAGAPESMSHGRARKALDFGWVTEQASICTGGCARWWCGGFLTF